jgi:hypothetical protein
MRHTATKNSATSCIRNFVVSFSLTKKNHFSLFFDTLEAIKLAKEDKRKTIADDKSIAKVHNNAVDRALNAPAIEVILSQITTQYKRLNY